MGLRTWQVCVYAAAPWHFYQLGVIVPDSQQAASLADGFYDLGVDLGPGAAVASFSGGRPFALLEHLQQHPPDSLPLVLLVDRRRDLRLQHILRQARRLFDSSGGGGGSGGANGLAASSLVVGAALCSGRQLSRCW